MRRKRFAVKFLIYAVLVIWLAGVVLCVGSGVQYKSSTDVDSRAAAAKQQAAQDKLTGVPQDDAVSYGNSSNAYQGYAAKWAEPMALLTIALVFGVFITARIYYKQLKKMEETVAFVGEQASTMKGQFTVMQGQLREMEKQSQTSRQLFEMQAAITNPRLRVAEVRVENFKAGKEPIYILTIANSGLIDATGVQIHMRVEMGTYKILEWINDPIVTIPAKEKEYFYIIDSSGLNQQHIDGFNDNVPLRVVGHFSHWLISPTEFCYKYQPWEEGRERPEGIRQFVRCDYDPRLNTIVRITGNFAIASAGIVTPVIEKAPSEETTPQEGTKPDGNDERKKPD
jgi:hypothetical protein